MTLSCPQLHGLYSTGIWTMCPHIHTHPPTPTLWHPSSPTLCTREQPERCHPLCGSVVLWFCGAVDGAAALSRLSPMLGSIPAALPELGPGGQNSSGSLGSFLTAGRVQYCSPAGSPGKSWTQDGICSGLKSPMSLATLVLPSDFGGPGPGDQPSRKPEGGRGRSCEREPAGSSWHPQCLS